MSDDFDPDAFLAEKPGQEFDPDAFLAEGNDIPPGSPLAKAMAEQKGDIVTVQTPTGPTRFDRQGRPVMSKEDLDRQVDLDGAKFREKALGGVLSFMSGGGKLIDEIQGLRAIDDPQKRGKGLSPMEVYRQARDEARRTVDLATKQNSPTVSIGDADVPVLPVLGSMVPALVAPGSGAVGRMLAGSASSAIDEVGGSTADLTKGQAGQFARDVGGAGALGFGVGAAFEGLGAGARGIMRGTAGQSGLAKQAVIDATQLARDKAANSAASALGGLASGGNKSASWVRDVLSNPHMFGAAEQAEAQAIAQSPEFAQTLNRAASSNFDKFKRFLPAYQAGEQKFADAAAAADPMAVAGEVASKIDPGTIASDLGGKFMRSVGQRAALGAAGSGLGAGAALLTGQDPKAGAALGATAGFLPQGVLQFARNQAKSPVVQYGANSLVSNLAGKTANLFGRAGAAGGPMLDTMRGQAIPTARPIESVDEEDEASVQAFLRGP